MSPVELILELRRLASEPETNGTAIRALLEQHTEMAEYQIARFYIARHLVPQATALCGHIDPLQRLAGVAMIAAGFPRSLAGSLLRRLVKDPDIRVRKMSRGVVNKLGVQEVALPDARYDPNKSRRFGHYNHTGWAFGLFRDYQTYFLRKRPAVPTRFAALGALGLPAIGDEVALHRFLGVDAAGLKKLMRPGTQPGAAYVEFEIPKAKGGTRRIAAPRGPLRRIQRKILDEILAKVPHHDAAHGFIAGRSTVTNAKPHVGAAVVIKTDLKDFFPTVNYRRVAGLFRGLGYDDSVATLLAAVTTYRPKLADGRVLDPGVLPQGAPTSPALANLACRRLDARLAALATKYGAAYTRYADDLTFSFAQLPTVNMGRLFWWIDGICQQEGFTEHAKKRKVLRANTQQRITGIVVNTDVHVPRRDRRAFRAVLHNCDQHGVAAEAKGRADFAAYLAGYAAYVQMVQPALGKQWIAEVERLLKEKP